MTDKTIKRKPTRLQQSRRALDLLIDHLDDHINRGIAVLSALERKNSEPEKYQCARLMLLGAGISLVGMKKFYRPINFQSKDIVVIFRVVFEGIVNALYVLSADVSVAKAAFRHAEQKKFRNVGKKINIGPFWLELQYTGEMPKDIDRKIQEFTSSRGRPKDWTELSVRSRIAKVAERYGDSIWGNLGCAFEAYYGHSSEYIHSSLFGIFDHISKKNRSKFRRDMEITVYSCVILVGLSVLALLDVMKSETGIDEFGKAASVTNDILLDAALKVGVD